MTNKLRKHANAAILASHTQQYGSYKLSTAVSQIATYYTLVYDVVRRIRYLTDSAGDHNNVDSASHKPAFNFFIL